MTALTSSTQASGHRSLSLWACCTGALMLALSTCSCGTTKGAAKSFSTNAVTANQVTPAATHKIQNVFLIIMENHNLTGDGDLDILDSPDAPYINKTLIPMGSYPSNYLNLPNIHPSLPNYLWLEAGTNFGILNSGSSIAADSQTTTAHLVTLLKNAGISWKAYDERTNGKVCPLVYWHTPFVFFDDVTNDLDPDSTYCISHIRPLSEMATDLTNNTTARYNFIVPNLCHDMHISCNGGNPIKQGDDWLKATVPGILSSSAYKNGGLLLIIWDESIKGDGPIPLFILSPYAKTGGYTNTVTYNHGSTLRTLQEIFGVTPLLGNAGKESDLSDFFTQFP